MKPFIPGLPPRLNRLLLASGFKDLLHGVFPLFLAFSDVAADVGESRMSQSSGSFRVRSAFVTVEGAKGMP